MHFGDRLSACIHHYGPLCVGLDPHIDRIPPLFGTGLVAVEAFFTAVLSRINGQCGAIKPQIAFFERFGPEGLAVLQRLCHQAKAAGLMVLMDAKRGDIGSTANAYAQGYLGKNAWLDCDAITVNPYMGLDTLEPFFSVATDNNKGVIVLVRTSNPGAADFEDLHSAGAPLYQHIANALAPFARDRRGPKTGWSSVMVVVGATAPLEAKRLRVTLPYCPFLVPGYGAQGAGAADALAACVDRQGVLVNSARGVLYPPGADAAKTATEWERLFDASLQKTKADLMTAQG